MHERQYIKVIYLFILDACEIPKLSHFRETSMTHHRKLKNKKKKLRLVVNIGIIYEPFIIKLFYSV